VAEELLEDRVKKLEKALESLAEVPKQLTGLGQRVERMEARTERIEGRVTNVELQISQLRSDMRGGFTAVLEVIDSSSKATQKLYDDGRGEMRRLFADLKGELKGEITQTRTDMRVLHEDFVERIKVLRKA
jgi:predicted  nucleic acid-binding Zn-ribbon protein